MFGIDLDGDGDVDVLSASYYDDTIAWYENLDGSGGSWSYHEIYTAADGAHSVFGIDLDGDGDIDVLSASANDDTIAWYENLDGSGGSWSYHEIYTAADGATRCLGSTSTATVTSTCSRPRRRRHDRVVRHSASCVKERRWI